MQECQFTYTIPWLVTEQTLQVTIYQYKSVFMCFCFKCSQYLECHSELKQKELKRKNTVLNWRYLLLWF